MIIDDHLEGVMFLLERGAIAHIPDYKDCDSCDYAKLNYSMSSISAFVNCPRVKPRVPVLPNPEENQVY